jgi:hypothetical protein
MGSSYTKQENYPEYREIPIDNAQPWEFAECFYESYCQLANRVLDLEQELILLKNKPHLKKPSPKPTQTKHKQPQVIPTVTDACCQTRDQSVMEIEPQISSPRRLIRCTSLRKKIFYTKVYVKKHQKREEMEIEKEKSVHHPKPKQKIPKKPQKFIKIFVRKEVMEIETETVQLNKTPPKKKANPKKTRHKGTPKELAPRKKRPKKNTPNKALDGSELKVNKILTQPTKVTLITDFFSTITKSQGCATIKIVPDPT